MDPKIEQRRRVARRMFGEAGGRVPLTSPIFNLREIAKQLLLLERHLLYGNQYCDDCIRKHLLTVEALAEEAVSLDQTGVWTAGCEELAEAVRGWIETAADAGGQAQVFGLAQEIRKARKLIVPLVFDPREAGSRVAAAWQEPFCTCQ